MKQAEGGKEDLRYPASIPKDFPSLFPTLASPYSPRSPGGSHKDGLGHPGHPDHQKPEPMTSSCSLHLRDSMLSRD